MRTTEPDGTPIAPAPGEVAETLAWLASEASRGGRLVSDMSQVFRVLEPLKHGSIRFEITTLIGRSRRETWQQDKIERYVEAGFLTRDGSMLHKRWTEPAPPQEDGYRMLMVKDDLAHKITMRKVEDLAERLFAVGRDGDALLVKWVADQAKSGMLGKPYGDPSHRPAAASEDETLPTPTP